MNASESYEERLKWLIQFFKERLPKKYADRIDKDTISFTEQRPYFQFWANQKMNNRVLLHLYNQTDLLVVIHSKDGTQCNASCQEQKEKFKMLNGSRRYVIPLISEIVRIAGFKEYRYNPTNMPPPLIDITADDFKHELRPGVDVDKLFLVEVMAPEFRARGKPFLQKILMLSAGCADSTWTLFLAPCFILIFILTSLLHSCGCEIINCLQSSTITFTVIKICIFYSKKFCHQGSFPPEVCHQKTSSPGKFIIKKSLLLESLFVWWFGTGESFLFGRFFLPGKFITKEVCHPENFCPGKFVTSVKFITGMVVGESLLT